MKTFWAWLARFALKRLGQEYYVVPQEFSDIVRVARTLCAEIAQVPDVSGEWRRHQVYATLLKTCPKLPKRVLALAIEVALNARTDH